MQHALRPLPLLVLLVAGCGITPLAPLSQAPATSIRALAASLFPTAVGTTWHYQVMAHPPDDPYVDIPGTDTLELTGTRKVKGATVLQLKERDAYALGERYPELSFDDELVAVRNVTYVGPFADGVEGHRFELLRLPAVVGSKWDDGLWAGKVLAEETVQVPAGTFRAFKVEAIGTYQQAYTVVGDYWIAPGTGIVKSHLNTPGGMFECELERMTPARR